MVKLIHFVSGSLVTGAVLLGSIGLVAGFVLEIQYRPYTPAGEDLALRLLLPYYLCREWTSDPWDKEHELMDTLLATYEVADDGMSEQALKIRAATSAFEKSIARIERMMDSNDFPKINVSADKLSRSLTRPQERSEWVNEMKEYILKCQEKQNRK